MTDKGNSYLNEQIHTWYEMNNITHEKCELYKHFYTSLLELIDETYLGSDVLVSDEDTKSHFNWCFKRVINDFKQERILFKEDGQYIPILFGFFIELYYDSENLEKRIILKEYFNYMFDIKKPKTFNESNTMIEFYKLLDKNLIKS